MTSWLCKLLLVSACLSAGCWQRPSPGVSDSRSAAVPALPMARSVEAEVFDSGDDVAEIPRGLSWTHTTADGKLYALERVHDKKAGPSGSRLRLHRLSPELKAQRTWELGSVVHLSNFVELRPDEFSFFSGSHRLESDGQLSVRYNLSHLHLEKDRPSVESVARGDFDLDTPILSGGKVHSGNAARALRRDPDTMEAYNEFYLSPGNTRLTLFASAPEAVSLHWSLLTEGGSYDLKHRRFLPVQPCFLDNHFDAAWKAALPLDTAAPLYVAHVTPKTAGWYYDWLGIGPADTVIDGTRLLVAREERGKLVAAHAALEPRAGLAYLTGVFQSSRGTYLLGRTIAPKDSPRGRGEVWLGRVRDGKLDEAVYRFPKNARLAGVALDPGSDEIFAHGFYDYDQASSGSVGHGKAFILRLGDDLTEKGRYAITGEGSTHIRSLQVFRERGARFLRISGVTNAPSTHDNRVSKGFIQTVSVLETGDK